MKWMLGSDALPYPGYCVWIMLKMSVHKECTGCYNVWCNLSCACEGRDTWKKSDLIEKEIVRLGYFTAHGTIIVYTPFKKQDEADMIVSPESVIAWTVVEAPRVPVSPDDFLDINPVKPFDPSIKATALSECMDCKETFDNVSVLDHVRLKHS